MSHTKFTLRARGLAIAGAVAAILMMGASARAASPDSAPPLPLTGHVVNVSSVAQLEAAVAALESGDTIVIAKGTYRLRSTLWINGSFQDVTIRGASNNRNDVVLVGDGMSVPSGAIPHGIWAGGNVRNLTIANLTVRDIYQHPIMLNAGTESPRIYNVRLVNAGQQFLKANPDDSGGGVDNGIVEYSVMEYDTTSTDTYTNGVDVHSGRDWIIRNNLFRRIRSASGLAGPAVLMWNGASGTIVEGNTFIDCHREISMGLIQRSPDHRGGIVRNNVIYRHPGAGGDVAIAVFDSPNTKIVHNTVFLNGAYPNAIEYRFPATTGVSIVNNLADAGAQARDGARAALQGNVWTATAAFFVDASKGDLHLAAAASAAIDKGVATADAPNDWDGQTRPPTGRDVGADERGGSGGPSTPPAETCGDGVDNDGDGQVDEGCAPEPVACVVSNWSAWEPSGAWSACQSGTRTRTEHRTRTIVTPAANGGAACPALEQTRTASQACQVGPGPGPGPDPDAELAEGLFAPVRLTSQVRRDTVLLGWQAPIAGTAPAGYVVEAGRSPGETEYSTPIGRAATTLTVPNVGPGRYYVRVRAANDSGKSRVSNEIVASVGCTGRPRRPTLTSAINGGIVSLSWIDPDGCSGTMYKVAVGSAPGVTDLASIATTQRMILANAPAGTYYVRVVSQSDRGASDPSNELKVVVNGNACSPPSFGTKLQANRSGGNVTLTWGPTTASAPVAIAADSVLPVSYLVEVGSTPGGSDVAVLPVGRSTRLTSPVPSGTYYLRVRPTDNCGPGSASNEIKIQ